MKYLCTFLISIACLFANAQDLSLNQLISYISQPVQSVSDSLSVKGWKVNAELSGVQENQMYQTFSYGNKESDSSQALAWLRIHADDQIINQLYYQLPDLETYTKMVLAIKAISTEKKDIESVIDNKQINTYYQTQKHTFQTIVSGGSYTLMVMINPPG